MPNFGVVDGLSLSEDDMRYFWIRENNPGSVEVPQKVLWEPVSGSLEKFLIAPDEYENPPV